MQEQKLQRPGHEQHGAGHAPGDDRGRNDGHRVGDAPEGGEERAVHEVGVEVVQVGRRQGPSGKLVFTLNNSKYKCIQQDYWGWGLAVWPLYKLDLTSFVLYSLCVDVLSCFALYRFTSP